MPFVLKRSAARVICFDPCGQVLLISAIDPADRSKAPWWELPGGGIEGGETPADTCHRELVEEAGVLDAVIGPCVWTQHARFRFAGWDFDQHERIHVATASGTAQGATQLESLEALAFRGSRWWPIAELARADVPTVPPRLMEFLPAIAAGERPDPPIDISP